MKKHKVAKPNNAGMKRKSKRIYGRLVPLNPGKCACCGTQQGNTRAFFMLRIEGRPDDFHPVCTLCFSLPQEEVISRTFDALNRDGKLVAY